MSRLIHRWSRRGAPIVIALATLLLLAAACSGNGGDDTAGGQEASATRNAACPPDGAARSLNGAGATFPEPLYTAWFAEYAQLCGVQVNYQGIGSGGGIEQITQETVDFGASDGIMNAEQKARAPREILHIPMTSDAVAVVYNLQGIGSGAVTLDGRTLADIFLGKVTKWNDPAIAALNPNLRLPDQDITVVRRSDGSGTTFIFTNYLSKVSPEWRDRVGFGTSVRWPTGVGGEGNSGVAGQVRQLPGSIGYVSFGYVEQANLAYAKVKNRAGNAVEPSIESAAKASEGIPLPDNMEVLITDSENPQAYPITGFTWLLVYREQRDEAKAKALGALINWMLHDAQAMAPSLNYVPLSQDAVKKAEALLQSVTYQGTPISDLN